MLEKIKFALRVDGYELDEEIEDLVDACLMDLKLSGVNNINLEDKLILRAVITYCRAHFDTTNSDFDKLCASYNSLKSHLALSSEYTVVIPK